MAVVDPLSAALSALWSKKRILALVKKDGMHAATVAYQRADPKDWAFRLSGAGFRGLERPRPRRKLARGLRKKRGSLRSGLNHAHEHGVQDPGPNLVDGVNGVLARSLRWRRLSEAEREKRAATVARNMLAALVESYDAPAAIAALDRAGRRRAEQVAEIVVEIRDEQRTENAQRAADRTTDRLAWVGEQLDGLPTWLSAPITAAFQNDSEHVTDLLRALASEESSPGETAEAWLSHPPAMLGTTDSPRNSHLWLVLAQVAVAYGRHTVASSGFECAARAGTAAAERLLALALWAAAIGGPKARVDALLADEALQGSTQPSARAVLAWLALERTVAVEADSVGATEHADLRAGLHGAMTSWQPQYAIEHQMKAHLGVRLAVTDDQASAADRFAAARVVLESALAREWVAQTALDLAGVLTQVAADGLSTRRASDLNRACALALEVRDERRLVRGDAQLAVLIATRAAGLALNTRRVIDIGRREAIGNEGKDIDTLRYVLHAAAQSDPQVADELEREYSQGPEEFVRLYAHAHLAIRPGRTPELPAQEKIALCQHAVATAQTPEQLLLARHDLTLVGGTLQDQPKPEELQDPDTAQMWARAALNAGDASSAVSILRPHRLQHPSVAAVLADAYVALGRPGAAVEELLGAARRFDQDDFCIYAALVAANSRRREKAEEILGKVLREASTDWSQRATALYYLGQMQGAREGWAEATASWEASLEIDPHHEMCRWMLAQCYGARGEFDRAWQMITTDPVALAGRREPPPAPTALLARMLLIVASHVIGRTATLQLGFGLLERFGHDTEFRAAAISIMVAARRAPGAEEPTDAAEVMLEDQLQSEMAAFTRGHPDHPGLRSIQLPADATGEELLALLTAQCQVTQLDVYRVKSAAFACARGQLPLGDLAAMVGLRYAEMLVAHEGGPISARGDIREHALSVADALHALGSDPIELALASQGSAIPGRLLGARPLPTEPVVLDTSALYAVRSLDELGQMIADMLAEVRMVDDAYLDIIAADEVKSRDQGLRAFSNPDTGVRGAIQTPSAILERHRAAIAAMRVHAASLRRDIAPASSLAPLDEHPAGRGRPWLESVRLCASSGAVLWADDVMVRATARQNNLRAFSTSALIDALHVRHLLTDSQREDATSALIRAHVGDFPPDRGRLEALYRQSEDGRDAVDTVVAKPAFWLDAAAQTVFFSLLAYARADSTRRVATLVGNAVLGIIRANAPLNASYAVAVSFLARVLLEPGMPSHVPAALEAVRQALLQTPNPLPDPLGAVAKRIFDEQSQSHTRAYAAAVLNGLTAECSEGDRRAIRLAILSI